MPQLVICHKCGAILYESMELKPPDDIIQSHDGKCPTCGKKLSSMPKNFAVKLVEETKKLGPLEPEKKKPLRKKSRSKTKKTQRRMNAHASYESRSGSIWKN